MNGPRRVTELRIVFKRNLKLGECPRKPSIKPHAPPKVRPIK